MSMKEISARYPGTCKGCGQPFDAGDTILWGKKEGTRHIECEHGVGPAPERKSPPAFRPTPRDETLF